MAHITQDTNNVYIHLAIPKANNLPARVQEAMVGTYGPIPTDLEGVPTMTAAEFAYQQLKKMVVRVVREWEGIQAGVAATTAAHNAADADTTNID